MSDFGGLYAEGRARLCEIVRSLAAPDLARAVPSCPGWTVQDVIAHLAGGCIDLLAGNIDGVTTAAWTDAQVRSRKDRTITEVVEEWTAVAPEVEAIAGSFPPPLPTLWILDLAAHEQDVRGALTRPGAREARGLEMAVDFLVRQGLHGQLVRRGLGPLSVRTPIGSWTVGGQAPSLTSSQPAPPTLDEGEAPIVVELSVFEAFRALTGRRSPAQIAWYDWTSDPRPFVPAFQFGPFTSRTADLNE